MDWITSNGGASRPRLIQDAIKEFQFHNNYLTYRPIKLWKMLVTIGKRGRTARGIVESHDYRNNADNARYNADNARNNADDGDELKNDDNDSDDQSGNDEINQGGNQMDGEHVVDAVDVKIDDGDGDENVDDGDGNENVNDDDDGNENVDADNDMDGDDVIEADNNMEGDDGDLIVIDGAIVEE